VTSDEGKNLLQLMMLRSQSSGQLRFLGLFASAGLPAVAQVSAGVSEIGFMASSPSDALQSFRSALLARGYDTDAVDRRLALVRRILAAMDPADTSDRAYRAAVDHVLAGLPDPPAQARCRLVAREFHAHFVAAGRRLPVQPVGPPARPVEIVVILPPHTDLDDLIQQALDMKPGPAEQQALDDYLAELKQEGLARDARSRRLAIARLLLLGLRSLPRDGRHYRALIERLLPLFSYEETRSYFLGVARDFHPHLFPQPLSVTTLPGGRVEDPGGTRRGMALDAGEADAGR
jgi:hypothetical protein